LQYIANVRFIVLSRISFHEMEVQLELVTNEIDEIQVMQKVVKIAKKAKELGFSIQELELETEEEHREGEEEEEEEGRRRKGLKKQYQKT
jgi:translation elongation factor EF-1beta